jgi:hypothetical protein
LPLIWLVALVGAQAFDYVSFILMIKRHGIAAEANPIVLSILSETGGAGLTLAKIASVAVVGLVVLILARRHPRMAVSLLTVGILAGVVGGISNVAAL